MQNSSTMHGSRILSYSRPVINILALKFKVLTLKNTVRTMYAIFRIYNLIYVTTKHFRQARRKSEVANASIGNRPCTHPPIYPSALLPVPIWFSCN